MLLAGDIGGTKTNLAIYADEAGRHILAWKQLLANFWLRSTCLNR